MEGRARALWERSRDATGTRWPRSEAAILPALRVTFEPFEEHEALTRAAIAAIAAAASTGYPVHGCAEGRAAFAPFWQMLRERGQLSAAGAREAGPAVMQAILTATRPGAAALANPSSRRRQLP